MANWRANVSPVTHLLGAVEEKVKSKAGEAKAESRKLHCPGLTDSCFRGISLAAYSYMFLSLDHSFSAVLPE